MKGKKVDTEFLSNFIAKCVQQGIYSPEEMVNSAKTKISNIDDKIKEAESLKLIRSKLLDVIYTFEKPIKNRKEEARILCFFDIKNQHICKFICDSLKNKSTNINDLKHPSYASPDVVFCIKQLLEYKVISRVGDCVLRGESFDEYMKFVLKEI